MFKFFSIVFCFLFFLVGYLTSSYLNTPSESLEVPSKACKEPTNTKYQVVASKDVRKLPRGTKIYFINKLSCQGLFRKVEKETREEVSSCQQKLQDVLLWCDGECPGDLNSCRITLDSCESVLSGTRDMLNNCYQQLEIYHYPSSYSKMESYY